MKYLEVVFKRKKPILITFFIFGVIVGAVFILFGKKSSELRKPSGNCELSKTAIRKVCAHLLPTFSHSHSCFLYAVDAYVTSDGNATVIPFILDARAMSSRLLSLKCRETCYNTTEMRQFMNERRAIVRKKMKNKEWIKYRIDG